MSDYSNVYPFSIPALGTIYLEVPGNYYKVLSSTGNLSTKRDSSNALQPMYAGRGEKGSTFQRLALTDLSGSINTGLILIASGKAEMVDTTLQLVGAVAVRPEVASGSYGSVAALAANTPDVVFLPSLNVNGAILQSADMNFWDNAASGQSAFLAKASAPVSLVDGQVMAASKNTLVSTAVGHAISRETGQYIPAGLGLYFFSTVALPVNAHTYRACRYKIL